MPVFQNGLKDIFKGNDLERIHYKNIKKRRQVYEESDYKLLQHKLEDDVKSCIKITSVK